MGRIETYRGGALVEWSGLDGGQWVHWLDGAEVERRPATAGELAAADAERRADTAQVNTAALTGQARAAVDTVLVSREVLRAIVAKTNAQITGADTKQVAREVMRMQKELLAVLRLISGRVDSTDTGSE